MAVPTKKIYGRNGKVMFDPSNLEDLRNYKEKQPYIEAYKLALEFIDPRTGGGLGGGFAAVERGVSTVSKVAKTVKNSKQGKEAFNQLASKLKSFQSTAKKGGKKAKSTVKEVVETKPTIPTTVPSTISSASNKIKSLSSTRIKAFENVKNVRELAEKQAKNVSTTTSNTPVTKELLKKPLPTPSYTNDGFRIGGTKAKSILSNLKDSEAAKNAAKKAFEKANAEIIGKGIEKTNNNAASLGVLAAVLGAGVEATAYGMRLSNKDNKQTTNQKNTSPVDLKRINESKLKDSNIEGVKTIKGSDGKDYGIQWNNTTKSWDYYRGGGKPIVKQTNSKQEKSGLAIGGGDSGGGAAKENNSSSNQRTTTGGGTSTKPRSTTGQAFDKAFAEARKQAGGAGGIFEFNNKKYGTALLGETVPKDRVEVGKTVAPVTTTYVGNEYAKANNIEQAIEEDSIRQQRKMFTEKMSKPLSSLVFKTSSKAVDVRNVMDEQDALRSIREDNKLPLNKKRYGGNLAMLKYMKQ